MAMGGLQSLAVPGAVPRTRVGDGARVDGVHRAKRKREMWTARVSDCKGEGCSDCSLRTKSAKKEQWLWVLLRSGVGFSSPAAFEGKRLRVQPKRTEL